MKKVIAILLTLCLCIGLCACGGSDTKEDIEKAKDTKPVKSAEAQKADELILAIGEVTADSETAILAAQNYYDTLTEDQKAEVEKYNVLSDAQKLLPSKKIDKLIENNDYLAASIIVYDNPDVENYNDLVKVCGENIVQQYIETKGEEKEAGRYFINLVNADGVQISMWYDKTLGTVQFIYYSTGYGVGDAMIATYTPGYDEMLFSRSTTNMGTPVNYQEGTISLSRYTGTFTGGLAENSSEPLVITGLTVTKSTTIYDKQTRGYQTATMSNINDMLDALYTAVTTEGYKGTTADIGFTVYKVQ